MQALLIRVTVSALLALTCASPAMAGLSRVSGPLHLLYEARTVVKFDVAFDPVNRVYLVVWGTQAAGPVNGQFLDQSGAKIGGVFTISVEDVPQSGWARVTFGSGKFLVSYVKIVASGVHRKAARFVAYSGGKASLGSEIAIDQWSGGAGTESGIGYTAAGGGRFLVTWWKWQGVPVSYVTTIDSSEQVIGTYQLTNPADGQSDPEIACDAASNRCLVVGRAWGVFAGGLPSSWARFVTASTGVPEGPDSFYFATAPNMGPQEDQTIAPLGGGNRFLAAYGQGGVVSGHVVTPASSTVGTAYVMRSGGEAGGYGGTTLIHNPGTQTTMLVTLSYVGLVTAEEIDANGAYVPGTLDLIPNPRGDAYANYWDWRSKFGIGAANSAGNQFLVLDNDYWNDIRASRYSAVPLGPLPLTVTGVTANTAMPTQAGTSVTWTAAANGGTAPLQYQFWRYTEGSGWVVGQDYSTSNTFTWAPPMGSHAIQVWVRNSGSTAKYDAYAATGLFQAIAPAPRLQSLVANTSFPAPLNVPITFTATASGGTGAIEYQFWRYNEKTGWQLAQPYGPSNTYTTYPPEGSNAVQVWIRTVGSGATLEDWKGTPMFSVQSMAARLTSLTPDFQFYSPIGQPITFTAAGTGGDAALEYKFFIYSYNTGLWYALNQWSPAPYVTWTPSPGTSGQYRVQAWVRSTGKAVQYEDWKQTSLFLITDSTSLALTSSQPLQGLRAGSVTFTATVGGPGPWEYRFITFDGSTWATGAVGAGNTFTWNLTPGTRALQVWIRRPGTVSQWERWEGTGVFVVNP